MKVLVVCSGTRGTLSPFIKEQMDALSNLGVEFSLFQIKKGGLIGYLLHYYSLQKTIRQIRPDLIHAHYGLSGLLANLQRRVPVVTTFHGSDINEAYVYKYSKFAHRLSIASIFVENGIMQKIKKHAFSVIIPCSVNTTVFHTVFKEAAAKKMQINTNNINILFSSSFNNPVKNYELAKIACSILEKKLHNKINLIELKGYSRDCVNLLINACDSVLLTSFSEGSPQFIKEAMACNCPIVSTNVGDVKWVLGNTSGSFITGYEPEDVAAKLKLAIDFRNEHGNTNGGDRIRELGLDPETVGLKILEVYKKILDVN
jgi:teichuronic acid biosynthesis glycosyltransferase TuaC